jgi:hypothetical protein
MKPRIQMVVVSTLAAAMLSLPNTVLTGQYSRVQGGPRPACPGVCISPTETLHAGPGPACPIGTACIK